MKENGRVDMAKGGTILLPLQNTGRGNFAFATLPTPREMEAVVDEMSSR